MKKKIKKLKLPLSKMTGNEKDYTAVLLEDVNSKMQVIVEVLHSVKEKGDATFEQVGIMTEKIDMLEAGQEITNKRLNAIELTLNDLLKEISSIKAEIKSLKKSISDKADKEKFETLELRIIRIEKQLELSTG